MRINGLYALVLLIVIGAWFSRASVPSVEKSEDTVQEPMRVVSDASHIGMEEGRWRIGAKCNIEFINGESMGDVSHLISKDETLVLTGWALDDVNERLPKSVWVRFTGDEGREYFGPTQFGLHRADVQTYFDLTDGLVASGFRLFVFAQDLPLGEYALTLILVFPDNVYACDNGRRIIVH